MDRDVPLIAIVGRPNVGKSTLYNRLVGGRPALVHNTPGLTRDRRYGEFDYFGQPLRVVDTGGLDPGAEKDVITAGIHRQARAAIEEADAVLFVVDAAGGVTALDREVAHMLRRIGRPVLLCGNKIDHPKRDVLTGELYALGMGDVYPISAAHGRGVDEMLEALVERLDLGPAEPPDDPERDDAPDAVVQGESTGERAREFDRDDARDTAPIRVAFVGKPNAGKSSLVNRLLGVERALVHHEPGTTTDPVDSALHLGGTDYVLVDTAGIRRKGKVDKDTEKLAVTLALSQVQRADVVVLVVDAPAGPSEQDARLAGLIEDTGRAVVVALNKADLLGDPEKRRRVARRARDELHFLPYAPTVFLSALRGEGVGELMTVVDKVSRQHRRRVATAELNRFFAEVCESHPPPVHRGHSVRIHYLTQASVAPPTFLLFANRPRGVSPAYRRYIKNQLRARYGFKGTPLRVFVRAKKKAWIGGAPKRR